MLKSFKELILMDGGYSAPWCWGDLSEILRTDIFVTLLDWSSHQSVVVRLCLTLCRPLRSISVLAAATPEVSRLTRRHRNDVTVTSCGTFEL